MPCALLAAISLLLAKTKCGIGGSVRVGSACCLQDHGSARLADAGEVQQRARGHQRAGCTAGVTDRGRDWGTLRRGPMVTQVRADVYRSIAAGIMR
jgi:UDP-3-O-[3-hydroxymyristoyl] glucosamine N-acyltransferase